MRSFPMTEITPLPLVVDVDKGLLARDPIPTGLWHCFRHRPLTTLLTLRRQWRDPGTALKQLLAMPGMRPPRLPLRSEVLDLITTAGKCGVRVTLISSLPETILAHMRDQLGLSAAIRGAQPNQPFRAKERSDYIAARFGRRGFDIVSAARRGQPGVSMARRAILAGLTLSEKRRWISRGVTVYYLTDAPGFSPRVTLRAGQGWGENWTQPDDAETRKHVRPETHPPSQDVSDVPRSQTGRAARS